MLGRDRDLLCPERPPYGGDTFPGKDALEDTLDDRSGFLVDNPLALVLFGRKVAVADRAGTAQALFHSRLEHGLDFPAGVGNIPLVDYVAEDGHNIKAVGGVQIVTRRDKADIVLVKGALQQAHLHDITPDSALVFYNHRCHVSRPDFIKHSVQSGALERRPTHAVVGKVAYVREAHFLCVVL